jgi:hypothetical protein
MKHRISMATFCIAIFLLASCNSTRETTDLSKQGAGSEKTNDPTGSDNNRKKDPPPRAFVGEVKSAWNLLSEGTAKIRFDSKKNAQVRIEFWESGKRSERIAPTSQTLISPGGEIDLAVHDADHDGNKVYRIMIGDGLGPNATHYEFPADLNHFLSRLPTEIVVKDGVPQAFLYLCVGKECRPGQGGNRRASRICHRRQPE